MRLSFRPLFAPDTGAATADSDAAETDSSSDDASADQTGTSSGGDSAPSEDASPPSFDDQNEADNPFDIGVLERKGDLEGSMAEIGGNLGRDQPDTEEGEAAGDEDTADQPDTEEGEAEEDEAETEDAAEGDEDEEAEAEADEEGEEDELDEPQGEELPSHVQDLASEYFPGQVVETEGQLEEALEQSQQVRQLYNFVDQMVESDENLARYMELRAQEDMEPMKAAFRAFDELFEAPDPEENPEEYAEYLAEKKKVQSEAEEAEQAETEGSEAAQRLDRQTAKSLRRLANKKDMSDDEVARFQKQVNTLVFGDDRGNVPKDQMERLYFALHKDKVVEQVREKAYQEGKKDGRNENIDEETTRTKGDGLPNPEGSNTPDDGTLSEEEKELRNLGQQFEQDTVTADDFAI